MRFKSQTLLGCIFFYLSNAQVFSLLKHQHTASLFYSVKPHSNFHKHIFSFGDLPSLLIPLFRTLADGQIQVLQFSSEFIVFRNQKQIFIHIIQCMKNGGICADSNRRCALFNVPKRGSADTSPFGDKLYGKLPA